MNVPANVFGYIGACVRSQDKILDKMLLCN